MRGRWPLVGRVEELDLVASAIRNPAIRAVVITGAAGVGKTRLAREAAEQARRAGWAVAWAIATEQTRTIPLGALAPLLPPRPPGAPEADRPQLLAWARRGLSDGRPPRTLVVVDDAPQLDELSAELVRQVAPADSGPRLVLTGRSGEIPDWLSALSDDPRVEHVRVQELGEAEVAELVAEVLGGAVDPATQARLWAHCRGNALRLRQLVTQGRADGALRCRGQVWAWDGPIGGGDLRRLLVERVGRISDADARALEFVAVGEPLPAEAAAALGIDGPLRGLRRQALVEPDATGRLRMAHPLYGSVVRARLTGLALRDVEGRLAEAFGRCGPLSAADVVRVGRWCLDADVPADPAVLLEAAQRALLLDPDLAERLARAAAAAGGPRFGSLHALARSLLEQQRSADAEAIYQRLLDGPLSVEERVGVTLEKAMLSAWNNDNAPAAVAALRAAEARAEFAPYAPVIASMRAATELFRGDPRAALAAGLPIARDEAGDEQVRRLAALAAVPALALTGRVGEALELAQWARAVPAPPEFARPIPGGPTYAAAQLEWERAFALRWAGRVDDAVAESTGALRGAAGATEHHVQSYGLLNAAAGGAWLAAGNVRDALPALRAGAAALRETDVNGTLVSCLADLARAEALRGDVAAATDVADEAEERMTSATGLFAASLGRARSVIAAAAGARPQAREEAAAAARQAHDAGAVVLEAACLHLLVRLDSAAGAVDRLAELATGTDAALVSIFAAHAAAAARADPGALEDVAGRFDAAGSRMLAAFAAAAAARAHWRAGRGAAGQRAAARSRAYAAACPGAPAPPLRPEPAPLTVRERDIVELVRGGRSNPQIADALAISVRTVESHLQHAYRKLGVRGRAQLAANRGATRNRTPIV